MSALASSITELHTEVRHSRQSSADTSLEVFKQLGAVSTQLGNLNQRIGSMLEVAAADRSRRDIFHKTPGRPELKFGPASLKGSPWLIVLVIAIVAMIAVPVVALTYFEVRKIMAPAKP